MEIELKRNVLNAYKCIDSTEAYCAVSCDIVVPDTQEDIARILSVSPAYKIKSKDIEEGRLLIGGELDAGIAYIPEGGEKLSTLHAVIPFDKSFEIAHLHGGCSTKADIEVTAIDARMLNPRKVLVSAELRISESCYEPCELEWFQKPEEAVPKVFMRTETEKIQYISTVSEKTFSLEEEYNIASESGKILAYQLDYTDDSADRVGNKMVVKGHAELSVLYLSGEQSLENMKVSIPFSQLFDIPDGSVLPDYEMSILSTGEYFELTDGKLCCDMHAVAQLVCTDEAEISVVNDMYACSRDLNVTRTVLPSEEYSETEYREELRLTHESGRETEKLLYVSARSGKHSASAVPITADVIYSSAGELYSERMRGELKSESLPAKLRLDAVAVPNGVNTEIRISAAGKIRSVTNKVSEQISAFAVSDTEEKSDRASLYLVRPESSDLWSIAKKYGADPAVITEINDLDGTDIKGRMLLIPRVI